MLILWHVNPLLGNDCERNSYTTEACLHGNNWKQQERNGVFCVIRTKMLYAGQLEQ
jgi:hypothetical protein